jgi:flavin reductase (DIM6/NTAB) family NADH-FMN oxidoreductase RutF
MGAIASPCSSERLFVPERGNERAYRDALGSFTTGITVVTAMTDQGPIGMTVNSFTSVSLEPPAGVVVAREELLEAWFLPAGGSFRHSCPGGRTGSPVSGIFAWWGGFRRPSMDDK